MNDPSDSVTRRDTSRAVTSRHAPNATGLTRDKNRVKTPLRFTRLSRSPLQGSFAREAPPFSPIDHDAAEAAAMAWFYAQPADPNAWKPGDPDPYAEGLLQSWRAHR